MLDRYRQFQEQLLNARSDAFCEKVVRCMVEEVVKDCPVELLTLLGQVVLDDWKQHRRDIAESN